jgi:hypothetical protein
LKLLVVTVVVHDEVVAVAAGHLDAAVVVVDVDHIDHSIAVAEAVEVGSYGAKPYEVL